MAKKPMAHKLPVQQLFILSICRFAEPTALTSVGLDQCSLLESREMSTTPSTSQFKLSLHRGNAEF